MARVKRVVCTDFWTDEKVVEMFSPEDKLFYLYLLSNPHTTQLGIYPIAKKVMAFEIGYSLEAVKVLLDRFENKYKNIKWSETTSEIAIKNYLVHSIVKGGKPVVDCLTKEINQVKDKTLLAYIYSALSKKDKLNESVKEILPLLNDNDNDNEESYHDSSDDSSHESSKKPQKRKYGPFQHVLLTDDEYKKLQERFPSDYSSRIIELDKAIEIHGYKYKNHYLVIIDWAEKDAKRNNATADDMGGFVILP